MNIPAVLKPDVEDENIFPEIPQHQMIVRLRGSAIIIEDADWILEDENGAPIRSLPTFRVMLDAKEEGIRLYVWTQESDTDAWPPDEDIALAGWDQEIKSANLDFGSIGL